MLAAGLIHIAVVSTHYHLHKIKPRPCGGATEVDGCRGREGHSHVATWPLVIAYTLRDDPTPVSIWAALTGFRVINNNKKRRNMILGGRQNKGTRRSRGRY
ncbi:hypothetical protein I79_017101 [Cricetulus griseus]|uniref:Uncharacterized protein n=1 Tax=Cricetulus griseus TaxID=10029 RepID=G3I155_CRIGR|nr:hypothetical protein I79_017101 [Cricetulus griseus]